MQKACFALLAIVLLTCAANEALAQASPSEEEIRAMVKNVKDYPTKHKLIAMGLPAVAPLFQQLGDEDARVVFETQSALRWIADHAAPVPSRRDALVGVFAQYVKPEVDLRKRQFAIELLSIAGGEKAARVLAPLLKNEAVRDQALGAIQLIPGIAANKALADAMTASPPPFRCAILRAIGLRRDPRCIDIVSTAMRAKEPEVRLAAIKALGEIGNSTALPALKDVMKEGAKEETIQAVRSMVEVADSLLKEGKTENAISCYLEALKVAPGDDERCAAISGLGRTASVAALPTLDDCLKTDSPAVKKAVLDAYLRIGESLLDKGLKNEAAPLYMKVLKLAKSESECIRALVGCGRLGRPDALDGMKLFLQHESQRVQGAAVEAIDLIPGKQSTQLLASALAKASTPVRIILLEQLGKRRDPDTVPTVLPLLNDPDESVQVAAIKALGEIASPAAAPELLKLIKAPEAEKRSDTVKVAATKAYLQIAHARLEKGDMASALKIYHDVLDLKPDEQTTASTLAGIGRIAKPESLTKVEPLADDDRPAVRDEATKSLIAIADNLATNNRKEAARIYTKALELLRGDPRAPGLRIKLRGLGQKMEFMARDGIVAYWWIIGPFSAPDIASWEKSCFPEKEVDFEKQYEVDGRKVSWKAIQTDEKNGVVNLDDQFTPNEKVAAYAYAEVILPKERDAVLKIGSDDGVICWVNSKRVHAFLEPRGLQVDQDSVTVHLNKGVNSILLKILEGGGSWNFCLKITDPDGKPVMFKIR